MHEKIAFEKAAPDDVSGRCSSTPTRTRSAEGLQHHHHPAAKTTSVVEARSMLEQSRKEGRRKNVWIIVGMIINYY
jgi:hypothetical protein